MKRGSSLLSETKRDFLPTLYKSGRPHAAVKPKHITDAHIRKPSGVVYKCSYKLKARLATLLETEDASTACVPDCASAAR